MGLPLPPSGVELMAQPPTEPSELSQQLSSAFGHAVTLGGMLVGLFRQIACCFAYEPHHWLLRFAYRGLLDLNQMLAV